jgi:hypothetical protein
MAMEIYPNKLYRNNGDGTFTDVAAAAGIDAVIQAMNLGFSDFDLDGDQDLYITDVQDGNIFYRNNGDGTFTDIAAEAGLLVNSYCWSAIWIDADHNGYDDLHVCTRFTINNSDYFYYNNGDGTFTDTQDPLFSGVAEDTYCSAKGDYNNDGFWDFAVTKGAATSYDLFAGIPNENHWLKFNLTGTYSNSEAIGTWIKVYAGGQMHSAYTMCGEHYLGQDSQYEILSLGAASAADSVEIIWPRGLVEKLYSVESNQTLILVEGDNTPVNISASNDNMVICEGSDLYLDAGEWTSYLWSTGSTDRSIVVTSPDIYWVQVTNSLGYTFTGNTFVNTGALPTATATTTNPLCYGDANGSIVIETLTENAILVWEDGSIDLSRTNLVAGVYNGTIISQEGCTSNITTTLEEPTELATTISTTLPLCHGGIGQAQAEVIGGTAPYNLNWGLADPNALLAGDYTLTVSDSNNCQVQTSFAIADIPTLDFNLQVNNAPCNGMPGSAEITPSGGTPPYQLIWMVTNTEQLPTGDYAVVIVDSNDCSTTAYFTITEPEPLFYNFSYTNPNNGANGSMAVDPYGGTPPYSITWNDGSTDFVRNNMGQGTYTFAVTDNNGCSVEAITYLLDTEVKELDAFKFEMMPNPCTQGNLLNIASSEVMQCISISDVNGRIVFNQANLASKRAAINIDALAAGIYIVKVNGEKSTSTRKLEITH